MEIIDDKEPMPLRGRGATPKYPWALWYKHGQRVRIKKGIDFDVDVNVMRQMLYQKARAMDGKVTTEVATDPVTKHRYIEFTYYDTSRLMDEELFDGSTG